MGRPFIEFLQAQVLPWSRGLYGGGRPGVDVRVLSVDEDTGASSVLLRYPAGYDRAEAEVVSADEELFVLAGHLDIDRRRYGRYGYAHLPGGTPRRRVTSSAGAVVLTFFSAEPSAATGAAGSEPEVDARLVRHVDAFAGEWGGNFHPQFPPGAGRKFLRRDPVDGEETWVLGTMPLRWGHRRERHPVVEEMYLISGTLVGHRGTMHPGAYFWRPPEEWHGPFGSPTGNLMLFRTKGGPLSTVYADDEQEFSWDPPHDPILPPELAERSREPFDPGCRCY